MRTDRFAWIGLLLCPAFALAWPATPLPPATQASPVAGHMVFNGLDMRAQVFQSSRPPAEIAAFYRALWHGKVVDNALGDAQVIGHRDGDYYITVQVRAAGSGSRGDIGVVDVGHAPKDFVPGHGLPSPMGSTVFNDIAYPDDAVPARTVAMVNRLSPMQNAAFFRERLAGEGWKNTGDNRCASGTCTLDYERGESRMVLVMTPADRGGSQVVLNVQHP